MKRRIGLCLCLAGALRAGTGPAAVRPLTIEAVVDSGVLRSKGLSAFQWRPDGKAFSYEVGDGGSALLLQDAATGAESVLIDSATIGRFGQSRSEKRFRLPGYAWFPDSRRILLNSGRDLAVFVPAAPADGDPEASGSAAMTGAKSPVSATAFSPEPLTDDPAEERDATVSPDGSSVAYVKSDNLTVLDLRTRREKRLTREGGGDILIGRFDWVYEEEFGIRTGFAWSPDSRRIAYWRLDCSREPRFPLDDFIPIHNEVEWMRYPKAGDPNADVRVGVAPAGGGRTVWADLGPDRDIYVPRIRWLPDGKTLAIQRLNRLQNRLDLLLMDVSNGKTRTVVSETDSAGWVDCSDLVYFLRDGRMIWGSERSDRMHLYLLAPDGTMIRPLTSGDWDVTALSAVSEPDGLVYFESNEPSPLETHLYRVSLDGGAPERLTADPGTHQTDVSPDRASFLDTHSDARTPVRAVLRRADGSAIRVLRSGDIPGLNEFVLSAPEFFTFRTADGLSLNAMLFKPAGFDSTRKYPVLVSTYGGPASQIVTDSWRAGMGSGWHQIMLQHGYCVFALDNRGTFGHGNRFMNRVYGNMGLAVLDQIEAARWLGSRAWVDSSRIGIWGWSGGGWMTCLALTRGAGVFRAGAAVAPVTDLRNYDTIWTERYMGLPAGNPEGYDASSALHWIDRYRGGLLLVHGTSDDNVHAANSLQLAYALENARKPFELMLYPRKEHGISGKDTQVHLYRVLTDFFLRNL
jgi:dipeptidyl-peptidase 4